LRIRGGRARARCAARRGRGDVADHFHSRHEARSTHFNERADKGWRLAPALFIAQFLRQAAASALSIDLSAHAHGDVSVLSRRCVQNVTLSPLRRH